MGLVKLETSGMLFYVTFPLGFQNGNEVVLEGFMRSLFLVLIPNAAHS